jgi:hypothetical protein
MLQFLGKMLARYLSAPRDRKIHPATNRPEQLASCLRRGDVLLVEGTSRFSEAIKYLTQSTWSHAAFCIKTPTDFKGEEPEVLVEADINLGVRTLPLKEYFNIHARICRPVGLSDEDLDSMVEFLKARVGHQYDLKNVFDLARYLIRPPPVPDRWKRRLLALGSGDPTRAICSSLIAQAFQEVGYPILPELDRSAHREVRTIRHHSLFAPRDFDVSPYFEIVKPTLVAGFDRRSLELRPATTQPPRPLPMKGSSPAQAVER